MQNRNLMRACAAAALVLAGCSEKSSGPITVPVSDVATVNITPSAQVLGTGKTTTLQAVALNAAGTPLPGRAITWTTINPAVASISDAGVVTGLTPGNAVIRGTSEGKSGLATIHVTQTLTTTGAVYLRDENVAYLADFFPVAGAPNARLTLSGETAMSASNGAFTLQAGIAPTSDFVLLNATMSSVQPAWYPWLYSEAAKPVPIGLYPDVPVTARPGFLKGVAFMDGGGWAVDWFKAGMTGPTIDRMQGVVGANLAVFGDMFTPTQLDIASNMVTITLEEAGLGSRQHYTTMVSQARARGMQFMMILAVSPTSRSVATAWKGLSTVPASNSAFWDAFFKAFTPPVLHQAEIARDLGIEYLGIGMSLDFLFRTDVSRWHTLLAAVRAAGYKGMIVYPASTNTSANFVAIEAVAPELLALFDGIVLSVNQGVLPATRGEVLGKEYSRARMRADARTVLSRVNTRLAATPKPVWVMLTVPSVHGGISTSEYIEPGLTCPTCGDITAQRTRDYYQQADMYQAWAEVINGMPTSQVSGLITWGYKWSDDFFRAGDFSAPGSAAFDKSANIRGKPAESVLSYWFKRW